MTVIFDASALLAWLLEEPGGESVKRMVAQAIMSTVNWAEVVQKMMARGADTTGLRDDLESAGLTIFAFTTEDAELTATMWKRGSHVSLADRACLALGIRLGLPVWTADRAWASLASVADVRVIRP